jgi:YD repeat-containing protein
LTSVFDAAGNQTSLQFGGVSQTPLRFDQSFTADSQLASQSRYSNLAGTTLVGTTSYAYDPAGNQTSIQDRNGAGSNIANTTYAYDAASRLTSTQLNGASPVTFTYDTVNELTNDGANAYSYDLAGNRTMTGYTTGTDNQLTHAGSWTYTYDNAGNLASKSQGAGSDTWNYGYDGQQRLTSATDVASGGGTLSTATYVYDVLGNRIEEDDWTSGSGATTTKFAYDGANAFADLSSGNSLQTRRLYAAGVDQIFARINAGGTAAKKIDCRGNWI